MNDSYNKKKTNLLKGICTLFVFIIFGYYSYQDSMNRRMLEQSLNDNAAPPQRDFGYMSSRLKDSSTPQRNVSFKEVERETYNAASNHTNDYDTFNEYQDEYIEDPEDEITYPPDIYDALTDGEDEEP